MIQEMAMENIRPVSTPENGFAVLLDFGHEIGIVLLQENVTLPVALTTLESTELSENPLWILEAWVPGEGWMEVVSHLSR